MEIPENHVELTCSQCGKKFTRLKKEADRCLKKGYSSNCSRKCAAISGNIKCPRKGNPEALKNHKIHYRADALSPFRHIILRCKKHDKKFKEITDLTPEFLKELWDKQGGRCIYTNIEMNFSCLSTLRKNVIIQPNTVSVDRIDSSKGYIQGNVELVCLCINYAKNSFSKDEMLDFIKKIKV